MGFGDRQRASQSRLVGHFGEGRIVTLKRNPRLLGAVSGSNRPTGYILQGSPLAGTTDITVLSIGTGNIDFKGVLDEGVIVTIQAQPGPYGVAVPARAGPSNNIDLTLDRGLDVDAGAFRDVAFSPVELEFSCYVRGYRNQDLGEEILSTDRQVVVSTNGALLDWSSDDVALLDGRALVVKSVRRVGGGPRPSGFVLQTEGQNVSYQVPVGE